ncbi:MAG: matrixin family metalloprotease [Planctomycetaceae bacterium]
MRAQRFSTNVFLGSKLLTKKRRGRQHSRESCITESLELRTLLTAGACGHADSHDHDVDLDSDSDHDGHVHSHDDQTHDHEHAYDCECQCQHCLGHAHPLYAEGTDPSYMDEHPDLLQEEGSSNNFRTSSRWQLTANQSGFSDGDATVLTWSIVADGTGIPGYNGEPESDSDLIARLEEIFGSTGDNDSDFTDEPWFPYFDDMFERWEDISGLTFDYEPADDGVDIGTSRGSLGVRSDIRIGGHPIDGNSNVLAYAFSPNTGDVVIDTNDSTLASTSNDYINFRNVMAHEVGHSIGISHVESSNANFLLEPFLATSFDGPQFDDILASHRLYGDALEVGDNDTAANATALGTLTEGSSISIGTDGDATSVAVDDTDFVSIDDDSDIDYFSFDAPVAGFVDVTLTPQGPTYNEGPQGGSQSSFDASAQSDLELKFYDTDGTTLLASASSTTAGNAETLTVPLPSSGTFFFV